MVSPYEELGNAVVILAAKDWSDGVFVNNEKRERMAAYKAGRLYCREFYRSGFGCAGGYKRKKSCA